MVQRKPIEAIIVGAGHRAIIYASYALVAPDRFKIVGVADPNEHRRKETAKMFGFDESMCFESADELAKREKLADCVINGTMDHQHVDTSIPLLRRGYDILLEKPFAVNEEEMFRLLEVAREEERIVMICHVLRYAPFYLKIKELLLEGVIGDLIDLHMTELVSYHHLAVSFVRGKWGNKVQCYAPIILAKCCHDLDMMMWLKDERPRYIASFGSDFQFDPSRKPENSGSRCMKDCPLVDTCLYSAKSHYMEHPERWAFYVWDSIEHIENPTDEDRLHSLKTDNIHGRCVWDCDHDNVDHQTVMVHFENGSSATLHLTGGTAKSDRTIHLIGTKGEIKGSFVDGDLIIRHITPSTPSGYTEEKIDLSFDGDSTGAFGGHGGGDIRLVKDFVDVLAGEKPSISATTLDDSILGHLLAFRVEDAREEMKVIDLRSILNEYGL